MTLPALLLGLASATLPGFGLDVDFGSDVRPILSDRCFECHGPDAAAREAELRLDRRDEALAAGAFVPGDVDASLLVARIRAGEMPPPESKLSVSAEELAILERWIAAGAEYATHWSFRELDDVAPPEVSGKGWVRDPLDALVLARLEAVGLTPAPEATPERWLRRVTFDLTGLPPTLEEVQMFLADLEDGESEGAYEHVVDRLFGSPRHAERMARDWLDLARYADTYGYQADVYRAVWPWRDWVLRAYESNLPYDDFVTWQLAGDLLPDATRDQRLATAFNRLHRQTNEGGSVEEEMRAEYVADRVHTFGTAFLGLTLECARCHDHKFDPVTQRDYYSLAAFFANIDESGLYSHFTNAVPTPTLDLPTPEQERTLQDLEARLPGIEVESGGYSEESPTGLPGLAGRYLFDGSQGDELANAVEGAPAGRMHGGNTRVPGHAGGGIQLTGDDPLTFPGVGHFRRWDPFSIGMRVKVAADAERYVLVHRSKAWHDSGSRGYQLLLEEGRPSFSLIHFWPGNALRVRALGAVPVEEWVHLAVTYDGSSRAAGARIYVDGVLAETEVVRDRLTRKIVGGAEGDLTVGERFRDRGFRGGVVDDLAVFDRALAAHEVATLFDPGSAGEPTPEERMEIARARGFDSAGELRRTRQAWAELVDETPEIMAMVEMAEPRPMFVLHRGQYDQPREEVHAATPAALPPMPDDLPRNRLGLARWMFGPARGLTARVAANRLWQVAFGEGLVPSPEDFGTQGAPPTDPELLEYLAGELVANGWNQRALLRRLVLSATYRQDSRGDRAVDDALHARHPGRRLSAEEVRDAALLAGDLLVEELGGPPVKPPQPAGLWREVSGQTYTSDTGAGRWRRSLYTFWKRTAPPPSMLVFDAAKRDVCVARRQPTTTPLQALAIWNDEQMVEAARAVAERLLRAADDDGERARIAFWLLCGRAPGDEERAALTDLVRDLSAHYAADEEGAEAAAALAAVGVKPPAEDLDARDVATWTVVATTLFSHDAFVTIR